MKLEQTPEFKPIVITLETKEEAELVWKALRVLDGSSLILTGNERDFMRMALDWFSTEAKL